MRKRSPFSQRVPTAGMIKMRGIIGDTVAILGAQIVGGDWAEGAAISTETELIKELGVSRSVVREAIRTLAAKGLIRCRTSAGTRVLSRSKWRLLDPDVMEWRIQAGDTERLLRDLLSVRLVLEPGVVFIATSLADKVSHARVQHAWEEMKRVYKAKDTSSQQRRQEFIEMDLEFHRALIVAAGSEILEQFFSIIETALRLLLDLQMRATENTEEIVGMDESLGLHEAVCDAYIAGHAGAAEATMRALIRLAIIDAEVGFDLLRNK